MSLHLQGIGDGRQSLAHPQHPGRSGNRGDGQTPVVLPAAVDGGIHDDFIDMRAGSGGGHLPAAPLGPGFQALPVLTDELPVPGDENPGGGGPGGTDHRREGMDLSGGDCRGDRQGFHQYLVLRLRTGGDDIHDKT